MAGTDLVSKIKVVLDSNIWISALISPHGNSAEIVALVIAGELGGVVSPYLLGEIDRSLSRPWFSHKYGISEKDVLEYLSIILASLEIVTPHDMSLEVRDPKDLPILGAAIAGEASFLITGDRDLLDDVRLKERMREQGISIISPSEFMRRKPVKEN